MLLFGLLSWGCYGAPAPALDAEGWSDHVADAHEEDAEEGDAQSAEADERGPSALSCPDDLPYASEVISFEPGTKAGFGQTKMPNVVLGPPSPGSPRSGSVDVLTLGAGGEIVVGFGARAIVNGPGPDLIVWENPFWQGGDPEKPFAELGEVALSEDGETWHAFPCEVDWPDGFDPFCAGWRPRGEYDPCSLIPLDPSLAGGDPFDLEDLGLDRARFVRIRDLSGAGEAPSAGFDLDAVGAIHIEADE